MRVNYYIMVFCLVFGIFANIYVIVKLNIGFSIFELFQKIQEAKQTPKCEIDVDNLLNFIENRHFLELQEKELKELGTTYDNPDGRTVQTMMFAISAGLGNKLFEVISLLGIAETLQRNPVMNATNAEYIRVLSQSLQPVFPKLVEQFDLRIIPYPSVTHQQTNWGACCRFDDPRKFINRTEQHLMLDGHYFQSYKYFDHIRPQVRQWLAPNKTDNYTYIKKPNGTAYNYSIPTVSPKYTTVLTPTLTPEIDLAFSRLFCDVTLITAPSSTFGWWLSYLAKRNAKTYYRDIVESKDGVLHEMRQEDFYPPSWTKLWTDPSGSIRKS
ncbi:hypothetical protein CAEBREN_18729 [Caenorhabditis brenneri]|uniref:Uncharacterized protein n=1 Tax=Caenorhabditis brenneri TaxID=135651 RepID=G0MIN7_CAEBE|nr:hypothetical protein CAEBREN_18729 [Caenorhabditis brenneri]